MVILHRINFQPSNGFVPALILGVFIQVIWSNGGNLTAATTTE
jgi:hypothetical protein